MHGISRGTTVALKTNLHAMKECVGMESRNSRGTERKSQIFDCCCYASCLLYQVELFLLSIDFIFLLLCFINFAAKVLKLDVFTRLCAQVRQQIKFRPRFLAGCSLSETYLPSF